MRIRVVCIFIFLVLSRADAQHFQFSQFYSSPSYLNPAFTGANVCKRFTINYRNQWSGIPGGFTTYLASFDHYARSMKSGIGLQILHDRAGPGALATTRVSGLYAYEARLNKKTMGRGGISVGTVQRRVDFGAFTFGDQIARNGAANSVEGFPENQTTYFDVGAGILLFTKSFWYGVSADHLNKPDQTLLNGISPLPTELKFHGGYKFIFEENESSNKRIPVSHAISFAFNYKKQRKFNQLDLGLYYNKNLFVIGVWYRGLPVFKPIQSYHNSDAVIFLLGLNVDKYKIGYSYDMTVSKLTNPVSNGAHEISMSYQFCSLKKPKRRKLVTISCPKF